MSNAVRQEHDAMTTRYDTTGLCFSNALLVGLSVSRIVIGVLSRSDQMGWTRSRAVVCRYNRREVAGRFIDADSVVLNLSDTPQLLSGRVLQGCGILSP